MANNRAMHMCLHRRRHYLQMLVLFLTLRGQVSAPAQWRTNSTKLNCNYRSSCKTRPESKIASRLFSRLAPDTCKIISIEQIVRSFAEPAFPLWKQMLQAFLDQEDLGPHQLPPVGTRNTRVLDPPPKSPCVGKEPRADLGPTLPTGSPNIGVQGEPCTVRYWSTYYICLRRGV